MNKLILGDNLEALRNLPDESVDLVYLDPPFFSNRNYEVIWGDEGEVRSFVDRWSGGMEHYIGWLKERVQEMHRVLKPTGSFFLHCDWHANAEIKVYILNKVFTDGNFRGEIIWKRTSGHSDSKALGAVHDTIFYYVKSDKFVWNEIFQAYDKDYVDSYYRYSDPDGRKFMSGDISAAGLSGGGYEYEWKGVTRVWRVPYETMTRLDKENRIFYTKNGFPRMKRYLDEAKGMPCQDVWIDIEPVRSWNKERIGYPTQKPETLLERIINLASNPGDVILDPFVGGGTTVAVAERLERQWVGIDQSVQAIKVTEYRLNAQQGRVGGKTLDMFSRPFTVQLHKYDYDTLRYKEAFEFETWIVQQYGGIPNTKQRGDFGTDGKTREGSPIQVKRSDGVGRNVVDNFYSAVQRFDKPLFERNKADGKPVGYIIAFSFAKPAVQEVARLKVEEGVIIQLVTVESIVPIALKPSLSIEAIDQGTAKGLREIEFVATGKSPAGIEFYAWDFNYRSNNFAPEILLDKDGRQTHRFKPGEYQIAVKVVDNDGLENVEVLKLKVNGGVTVG